MTLSSNFEINNLTALSFKDAEIMDASAGRSYGRRFKLKIGTFESKEYKLCDIYKKVQELSRLKIESNLKIANLTSLKIFLGNLKIADALSEDAFWKRDLDCYKILNLFLRLFNSGSHSVKIDGIGDEIQFNLTNTNLDIEDKYGNTPLATAAHQGDITLMKCLINAGADVNYPNSLGDTPLFYASRENELEALKVLLEFGADCNIVNNLGETALICATSCGHKEIVEWLLQNKNIEINLQDKSGKTALIYGTSHYFERILELLLKNKNINVNLRDNAGKTAFQYAVSYQNAYFAGLLLENKNIEINYQDKDGKTTLMQATSGRMEAIARILLTQKTVKINLQDKDGKTALMYATSNRDEVRVKLLLEHKDIEINLQDKDGKTALMYAISNRDEVMMKLLLEHEKIDINHQDAWGLTAFMIAKSIGCQGVLKVLTEYLTQNDFILQKEMLKLKLLAHSNELGGTREICAIGEEDMYNVLLEGSTFPYILKKMKKATDLFPCENFGSIESGEVLQLTNFINTGFESSSNSLKLIKKGLPVFIHSGFENHSVAVIIWGSYFVLCNRGDASRKVVEVFKYDPKKIKHRLLDEIREQKNRDLKSYECLFFEKLPKDLGFQVQGSFELALEKLCGESLDFQSVGNCNWASPETAIFIFFALNTILASKNRGLDLDTIPSTINDEQCNDIKNRFHIWLSFVQTYQLERYLGSHVIRSSESAEKIEKRSQLRKAIELDYAVLQASLESILFTAGMTQNHVNILEKTLIKLLSLKTSGDGEQHNKVARKILDSIETITPEGLKAKFEQ
jgi:ankyrin repeat protein